MVIAGKNRGITMQSRFIAATLLAVFTVAAAHAAPARPKITGISHIAIYTSDPANADYYYNYDVGAYALPDPENPQGKLYAISTTQYVEVLPLPAGVGINRLDHIAFNTTSAEGMRKYLAGKKWKVPEKVENGADGSLWFTVLDPEGNKVEFVQPSDHPAKIDVSHAIGHHIIHVGIKVNDRAKEDTFYRALLGLRPYWWGGTKPAQVNWVSQQVPDGHDWLEYMLSPEPHTAPANVPANVAERAAQQQLGVTNHLSIGEVSVPEAFKTLVEQNRLPVRMDPAPKVGLDGKWQYNMYDPDGTRLELMNFQPTEKPCCSSFTAENPSPSE
jgi:catechol 2,3-dioxygenase-like lactoylglutathione lyase family enzyme